MTLPPRDAARLEKLQAWRRDFRCPDPSGTAAPCTWEPYQDPLVPGPEGTRVWCPIYKAVNCGPWQRQQERNAARAAERERREWLEAGLRMRIPKRFLDVRFDVLQPTPAVAEAKYFLEQLAPHGRALFLLGSVGVGKTVAAIAALRAWGRRGFFLPTDAIGRAAAHDHDELADLVEEAHTIPLLVVDDLGRGYISKRALAAGIIEEIFAERHAQQLATIATSNWTPDELSAHFPARVRDRLREWARVAVDAGSSLRGA